MNAHEHGNDTVIQSTVTEGNTVTETSNSAISTIMQRSETSGDLNTKVKILPINRTHNLHIEYNDNGCIVSAHDTTGKAHWNMDLRAVWTGKGFVHGRKSTATKYIPVLKKNTTKLSVIDLCSGKVIDTNAIQIYTIPDNITRDFGLIRVVLSEDDTRLFHLPTQKLIPEFDIQSFSPMMSYGYHRYIIATAYQDHKKRNGVNHKKAIDFPHSPKKQYFIDLHSTNYFNTLQDLLDYYEKN